MFRLNVVPFVAVLLTAFISGCAGEPTAVQDGVAYAQVTPNVETVLREGVDKNRAAKLEAMSDRELLVAMLTKLDALEARLETETRAVYARMDSFVARVESGGEPLGVLGAPPVQKERSRGTQQCLELNFGTEAEFAQLLEALGRAEAGLGAWAGSGAFADLLGRLRLKGEFKVVKGAIQVKKEWCFGRSASRQRTGVFGVASEAAGSNGVLAAANDPNAIEDQIEAAIQALGLTEANASRALDEVARLGSSLPDCRPRDCAASLLSALPLPGDLRSMFANPAELFRQRAGELGDFALEQLCSLDFGSGPFGAQASQACDLRGQMPDVARLVGIFNGLDGLPTRLSALTDNVGSICGRVKQMLNTNLVIPKRTVDFGQPIGEVTTFPGYSARLFPAGLSVSC